jgi:hypothetical protein
MSVCRPGRLLVPSLALLGGVSLLAMGAGLGVAQVNQPAEAPASPARGGGPGDLGKMLVEGLRTTEGCLGVDSGQFQSGFSTIVAWFENKAAAERWYFSPTHARLMGMAGADPQSRKPLEHVADADLPVMVIASIAFDGPPAVPGSPIPFSKISIEMYTPLPGGAAFNGRLAPEAFPIPHFRRLDNAGSD